jgi:predicted alpha/beta-fold hydrolase
VRINLRGCGTGHGLARLPYHAGCSEDILTILKNFRLKSPESPFSLIGYSMGGNIALKLAGELGTDADQLLQQCIAVCPPINLHTSARLMSEPRNLFYRTLFIRWRVQAARENAKRHPEVSAKHLSPWMTFREFDECYTAPNRGFRGAMDYYTSASSELVIPRIQVDTKIVFSGDDPIIDCNALDNLQLGPHMQIFKTNRGGHVGFLGSPQQAAGIHWLDHKILHWVLDKPVAELTEAPVEESRNVDASPALQETP